MRLYILLCVAYLPSHPTLADFEFDLHASILSFSQFKFVPEVRIDVATTRTLTALTNVNTQVMYFIKHTSYTFLAYVLSAGYKIRCYYQKLPSFLVIHDVLRLGLGETPNFSFVSQPDKV